MTVFSTVTAVTEDSPMLLIPSVLTVFSTVTSVTAGIENVADTVDTD